jgi:hypothetical protein
MNPETSLSDTQYRMELFLRSLAPDGAKDRQDAAIARLEQLQRSDAIESYSVTLWGDRFCPETAARTDCGRSILEKIDRIRKWEETSDVSLVSGFEKRQVGSLVDDPYTVVIPPVISLAVYVDGDLYGVFPCEADGEVCTVTDFLDAFAEGKALPETPSDIRTFDPSTVTV